MIIDSKCKPAEILPTPRFDEQYSADDKNRSFNQADPLKIQSVDAGAKANDSDDCRHNIE